MAEITVTNTNLGNSLQSLLMFGELQPGDSPSYEMCKVIYLYHPLGAKMAESPISMAMSQQRKIAIPKSPESVVREKFIDTWTRNGANVLIHSLATQARVYGVSALGYGAKDVDTDKPIDPWDLHKLDVYFNIWDPLNAAGSLVLNQDPNAPDFQKPTDVQAAGKTYHRSRAIVLMHERPIYIAYTTSAFGYVGRSVYQRALFPLKTFVQTMVTDDMVTRKAGLLIAKMKTVGSIIDNVMQRMASFKRALLKQGQTEQVLSIDTTESVETLNMQNLEGPATMARTNVLKNVATAADMPAKMLENETMVAGFGEGTEDAKNIGHYIDRQREWLQPVYDFLDPLIMHMAWTPEFYDTVKAQFPEEYGKVEYKTAFYQWKNSFKSEWPSFLTEPESETIKVEDIKQKSIIAILEVLLPQIDPINKAAVLQWAADNFNENTMLYPHPLLLDIDEFKNYVPPEPAEQPKVPDAPEPESRAA